MMSILAPSGLEPTLRSWTKKSSDNEEARRDRTEREVRAAFANSSRLAGVPLKIYVKGSYANNTNVRLDYDVDVAVEYRGMYYIDATGAEADVRKAAFAAPDYGGPYGGVQGASKFKADVEHALSQHFGSSAIERGNLSLRVRERKTTLPADIVPCFTYRYVHGRDWRRQPLYHEGTRLYPDQGPYIHNWPQQQYDRGVAKNLATGRRYKRLVRALKRLENKLVVAETIAPLPSFFMECLVYNVPNGKFGHLTYAADMRAVLACIFNSTLDDAQCERWLEASERKWLFGHGQSWTQRQAHQLADAAWDYLGFE
jgi:hypothetical protein